MNDTRIREIAALGPVGFGCSAVVSFAVEGMDGLLRYTFPTADEDCNPGQIVFKGLEAYRWLRNEVTPPEISVNFDVLVEVVGLEWAEQATLQLRSHPLTKDAELHHYLVYFDEFACYEVLARSASVGHGA